MNTILAKIKPNYISYISYITNSRVHTILMVAAAAATPVRNT
jgi:hypothetical protein